MDIADQYKNVGNIEKIVVEFSKKINTMTEVIDLVNIVDNMGLLINDISEQMNLLALNVARVGEAGKDFSVVAEEIRKLAEQSNRSFEDIQEVLQTILKEDALIIEAKKVENKIENQESHMSTTLSAFDTIISSVNNVDKKIITTTELALTINSDIEVVNQDVSSIKLISEKLTETSEGIAASAEEMSASTEEVSAAAIRLNELTITMN